MKILIRFDDICPTMDFAQWARADAVLRKYGVKPLLGVIPDCADDDLKIEASHEDFWAWVRDLQSQGYAIAMHGVHHRYITKARGIVDNVRHSEFAGVPYDRQLAMIREGRRIMEAHGIHTDVFFAPAHSYDDNTLRALAEAGFAYVSDGKSKKAYLRQGIKCLPCISGGVPHFHGDGYFTAVFHAHEWTRPDKARAFDDLQWICEKYRQQIVSFEEYARQPLGNEKVERLREQCALIYFRHIRPMLSSAKRMLKK